MLPESAEIFTEEYEEEMEDSLDEDSQILPTRTYKLDFINNRIIGTIEDEETVLQFIKKVLRTDKYAHVIYDWYYGHELLDLVGQSYEFAVATLPRIIEDALLSDDRILSIEDYNFEKISSNSMTVSFTVVSIYSKIDYEMEVEL